MFYYNKVDLSEGKPLLVLIMRLNFKCPFVMVAMANINVNYRCNIHDISKSEAIHLLENSLLDDLAYI